MGGRGGRIGPLLMKWITHTVVSIGEGLASSAPTKWVSQRSMAGLGPGLHCSCSARCGGVSLATRTQKAPPSEQSSNKQCVTSVGSVRSVGRSVGQFERLMFPTDNSNTETNWYVRNMPKRRERPRAVVDKDKQWQKRGKVNQSWVPRQAKVA